jgi:hypothetical protein
MNRTMISLMFLGAAVLSTTVLADAKTPAYITVIDGRTNPTAISVHEAAYAFYTMVVQIESKRPGEGLDMLSDAIGERNEQTARDFYSFIRSMMDETKLYGAKLSEELCLKRNELSSVELVAQGLTRMESDLEARRIMYIDASESVIGKEAKAKFDAWLLENIRTGMTVSRTDRLKWMVSTGTTPATLLERLCGQRISTPSFSPP